MHNQKKKKRNLSSKTFQLRKTPTPIVLYKTNFTLFPKYFPTHYEARIIMMPKLQKRLSKTNTARPLLY
jgi:hypothetical protein